MIVTSLLLISAHGARNKNAQRRMEVMVFDFHRVFNQYMTVGECVPKIRLSTLTRKLHIHNCASRLRGTKVYHRIPKDVRGVVELKSPQDLFDIGGLCDGVSATSLGLLKHGDCVMADMAKGIEFSNTTYTIALYANIRLGIMAINAKNTTRDPNDDRRYINDVTRGALELIVVTMYYTTPEQRDVIKGVGLTNSRLAPQFEKLTQGSSGLNKVKVSTFSSSRNVFHSRDFYLPALSHVTPYLHEEEFFVRDLNIADMDKHNLREYHLKYGIGTGSGPLRTDSQWVQVTTLEAKIVTSQRAAKEELDEYCKAGRFKKKCMRLASNIKRAKTKTLKQLHRGRQQWYLMTSHSRKSFISKNRSRVKSMVRKLARNVQQVQAADLVSREGKKTKIRGGKTSRWRDRRKQGKKKKNRKRKNRRNKRKRKSKKKRTPFITTTPALGMEVVGKVHEGTLNIA